MGDHGLLRLGVEIGGERRGHGQLVAAVKAATSASMPVASASATTASGANSYVNAPVRATA